MMDKQDFYFRCLIVLILGVLAVAVALGKVQETTSYGLREIIVGLLVLGGMSKSNGKNS